MRYPLCDFTTSAPFDNTIGFSNRLDNDLTREFALLKLALPGGVGTLSTQEDRQGDAGGGVPLDRPLDPVGPLDPFQERFHLALRLAGRSS